MLHVEGGAIAVSHWGTRKYKKHAAYLHWLRKQELRRLGVDVDAEPEVDDGKPSWKVDRGKDSAPDWETESWKVPR